MSEYLKALHRFLTDTGAIGQAHVVTAAQNDATWAIEEVATLRGKFQAALGEMRKLDPDGGGLRGGVTIKLPGQE